MDYSFFITSCFHFLTTPMATLNKMYSCKANLFSICLDKDVEVISRREEESNVVISYPATKTHFLNKERSTSKKKHHSYLNLPTFTYTMKYHEVPRNANPQDIVIVKCWKFPKTLVHIIPFHSLLPLYHAGAEKFLACCKNFFRFQSK